MCCNKPDIVYLKTKSGNVKKVCFNCGVKAIGINKEAADAYFNAEVRGDND